MSAQPAVARCAVGSRTLSRAPGGGERNLLANSGAAR